jgi:hypothetical protein
MTRARRSIGSPVSVYERRSRQRRAPNAIAGERYARGAIVMLPTAAVDESLRAITIHIVAV